MHSSTYLHQQAAHQASTSDAYCANCSWRAATPSARQTPKLVRSCRAVLAWSATDGSAPQRAAKALSLIHI
eukprot:6252930-Alexandrium_andersonii.AAC.1